MSLAWFLAFRALTGLTGTEQCELMYLDEKVASIEAVAMSMSGEILLSQYGKGKGLVAIVQRDGADAKTWRVGERFPNPVLKGVDDNEMIVGNFWLHDGSQLLPNAFAMRGEQSDVVAPPDKKNPKLACYVHGVAGSGEVFGTLSGMGPLGSFRDRYETGFVWSKGGYTEIDRDALTFPVVSVARTAKGVLGFVSKVAYPTATSRKFVGVVPVLFRSEGTVRLPLPTSVYDAMPRAASPDGSLIVGVSRISPLDTPVVWDQGVPSVPAYGKMRTPTGALTAVASWGETAVGSIFLQNGRQVAVAWQREKGMRSLTEIAAEEKVILPYGWRFFDAVGVSPDGKVIFGNAVNWKGRVRLWLDKRTSVK